MNSFFHRLFFLLTLSVVLAPACQKNELSDAPLLGHWEGRCWHVYRGTTDTVPGSVFGVEIDIRENGSGDLIFKDWGLYPFTWISGPTFTSMRLTCGPGVDFRSTRLDPITLHVENKDSMPQRWIAPFTMLRNQSEKIWISTEFIFEVTKQ